MLVNGRVQSDRSAPEGYFMFPGRYKATQYHSWERKALTPPPFPSNDGGSFAQLTQCSVSPGLDSHFVFTLHAKNIFCFEEHAFSWPADRKNWRLQLPLIVALLTLHIWAVVYEKCWSQESFPMNILIWWQLQWWTYQSCLPTRTGMEEIKGGTWEKSDSRKEETASFVFFRDFPACPIFYIWNHSGPISQFSEMQFSGKNEVVGRVKSGCTVGVHLRLGGLGNSYCPAAEVSHCLPLYEQPLITKQASWPTQTPAGARSSYFPLSFEHLPSFLLLLSYVSSVRTRTMHCFSDPRM